jgi:hypothetical protein
MTSTTGLQPGWYRDLAAPGEVRWFDGTSWTEHVAPDPAMPPAPVPVPTSAPAHSAPAPVYGVPAQQSWQGQPGHPVQQGWQASPVGPQQGQPAQQGWNAGAVGAQQGWVHPGQLTYPVPAAPRMGASPSDAMHWIVPVGRSWQSILAGYLGLFGLLIWPLAPFALGLGVWAMRRARDGGHGRGRAVFALIAGAIGTLLGIAALSGLIL